ncbi:unnamed protein product [Moneuplotes crassus]|uniref:Uncharacterized protein n=1 Tax=Euplotes crassus TaxID=5936 RepID=A0AAD1XDQ4_EUPCR|nr:unnamed protein product [Moneuplotes crassus]
MSTKEAIVVDIMNFIETWATQIIKAYKIYPEEAFKRAQLPFSTKSRRIFNLQVDEFRIDALSSYLSNFVNGLNYFLTNDLYVLGLICKAGCGHACDRAE